MYGMIEPHKPNKASHYAKVQGTLPRPSTMAMQEAVPTQNTCSTSSGGHRHISTFKTDISQYRLPTAQSHSGTENEHA